MPKTTFKSPRLTEGWGFEYDSSLTSQRPLSRKELAPTRPTEQPLASPRLTTRLTTTGKPQSVWTPRGFETGSAHHLRNFYKCLDFEDRRPQPPGRGLAHHEGVIFPPGDRQQLWERPVETSEARRCEAHSPEPAYDSVNISSPCVRAQ
eukprot:1983617-Prymnesium_polylepis.1